MKRKLRRATKQYMVVAIICTLVIGGSAVITTFLATSMIKSKYKAQLAAVKQEMEDNKRTVYVSVSDIKTGDAISSDNVILNTVFATQPAESFISGEDIGKTAVIDIPVGTLIVKSMLSGKTISSDLRELEYNVIHISSNIVSNDTVDVRISYPNGESFIILAKKTIMGLFPETVNCFFWLEEEEFLRMSAAIVDAGLYPGSSITVTKYIEPTIQEASIVTYTPSLAILSLIEDDPNIVTRCSQELNRDVRKALENRLAASMEADVSAISWDVSPNIQMVNTPSPVTNDDQDDGRELGDDKSGFMYYSEEAEAMKGDAELGE